MKEKLLRIHGSENCHICGKPKIYAGSAICSYPHGMIPVEEVVKGLFSWEYPNAYERFDNGQG